MHRRKLSYFLLTEFKDTLFSKKHLANLFLTLPLHSAKQNKTPELLKDTVQDLQPLSAFTVTNSNRSHITESIVMHSQGSLFFKRIEQDNKILIAAS